MKNKTEGNNEGLEKNVLIKHIIQINKQKKLFCKNLNSCMHIRELIIL